MERILCLFLSVLLLAPGIYAQDFDELRSRSIGDFEKRREASGEVFKSLRDKANAEYAREMNSFWEMVKESRAVFPPKERKVRPQYAKPLRDSIFHEVIPKVDTLPPMIENPAPEPLGPIVPDRQPENTQKTVALEWYGHKLKIRVPAVLPHLASSGETEVSRMWEELCSCACDNMLSDCLEAKKSLGMPDWSYVTVLGNLAADAVSGDKDRMMLHFYLLAQSGFDVIPARSEKNELFVLINTDCDILGRSSWNIDGRRYYLVEGKDVGSLYVFKKRMPGASPARMRLRACPEFAMDISNPRRLSSARYPEMTLSLSSNRNIINFLGDYPVLYHSGNTRTRWVLCADMSLGKRLGDDLYTQARAAIGDRSEKEAVELLLNFVQTAFNYETDDRVWGGDRVFYPQETLYYPSCDCEDRAILLSRMVRDILGLEVALVYYPGHLATAVRFNSEVRGDAFLIGGERFVVCDPTYINAVVGQSMPGLDRTRAEVMVLK